MARMSIYVPDDLKMRMDPHADSVNWSGIAQRAFEAELMKLNLRKAVNMETVIERLRASKAETVDDDRQYGSEHGRQWAMEDADYKELRKMAKVIFNDVSTDGTDYALYVSREIGLDTDSDSVLYDSENSEWYNDDYVEGFVEGAQGVWEEVSDKL